MPRGCPPTADDLVLADVRWYLDGRSGRDAFVAATSPAPSSSTSTPTWPGPAPATDGRHPLPTPEAFAAALGRLGIGEDDAVVAYDDSGGGTAGRLVWMLRVLGHPAALLDGGLRAWPEPPESGPARPGRRGAVAARPWPADRFADHDVGGRRPRPGRTPWCSTPARPPASPARRRPIDRRAGHIPGAAQRALGRQPRPGRPAGSAAPTTCGSATTRLGVDAGTEVVCYCGSGVSACADLIALEHIGVNRTRLYVPSWSGWSADPARPAATGSGE